MPREAAAVLQEMKRKRALHIDAALPPSPPLSAQSPGKRAKGFTGKEDAVPVLAVGLGFLPQPLSVPPLSPVSPRSRGKDSPLCESPSKLNCGGLRLEELTGFKQREKAEALVDTTKASTPHASAPRRSPRGTSSPWTAAVPAPVERRRTQAVTELVFRVALGLVARTQGEGGSAAARAAGDAAARADAARQERWPRACHPLVLDLLLNIVTAEEALARQADRAGAAGGTPAASRARNTSPLSRLSTVAGAAASGTAAATATPRRGTPGSRNSRGGDVYSTPRVRFHTYDLPAVETPDVCRPGSDQPMKALLSRAQRILAAAKAVRQLLREGEEPPASSCDDRSSNSIRGEACAAVATAQETRSSLDALVGALEGLSAVADDPIIANSRGPRWGPEHRKAAAFYAGELRLLCLEEGREEPPAMAGCDGTVAAVSPAAQLLAAAAAPRMLAASHVHGRYQDALSSVLRYELKSLLNICVCDEPSAAAVPAPAWGGGRDRRGSCTSSDAGMDDGEEEGEACSCLVVVEGTGSVMFNLEDPAALLNLALQRIYPLRPLAVELFPRDSVAKRIGSGGSSGALQDENEVHWDAEDSDSEEEDDGCDVNYDAPEERRRRKVWRRTLRYVRARRNAAGGAAGAASGAGASPSIRNRTVVGHAAGGGVLPMELENLPEGGYDASNATGAVVASESFDGGDGGAGGNLVLTADELRDMLGYVAAHQFLADLFSDPAVLSGVAAGQWARVESRAKEVHAFQSESADNGCLSLLQDVASLAEAVALQAPTVATLGQLLREEAAAAARRQHGRNNCRKRLKSRLLAATAASQSAAAEAVSDGLAVFPAVRPCCRRVLSRSCWS